MKTKRDRVRSTLKENPFLTYVRLCGEEPGRDPGESWGWRTSEAEVDEELSRIYSSGQEDALHAERINKDCLGVIVHAKNAQPLLQ